jgi:methyl-accepting chemotaxis protein
MTWVYVLGVAVIVVLWVICLAIGDFHKMVGEQLARIHSELQSWHNERHDLRGLNESSGSNDKQLYTVVEKLSEIARTLDQISTRVHHLQEPGRNTLTVREAARSIRESAAENSGAHLEEAKLMYAGISRQLDDIAKDLSTILAQADKLAKKSH